MTSISALIHISVLRRVQTPVLFASLWAFLIYTLSKLGIWKVGGANAGSLTAILSMVTGLMVSFRSGSSYDRWYEGRRTWAAVQSTSRTILRLLVISQPPNRVNSQQEDSIHEICALVCAFSFAAMEQLRDKPGVSQPQLRALLPQELLDSYGSTPASVRRGPVLDGAAGVHHSSASEGDRSLGCLNTTPSILRAYPSALASGAPTNLPLSLIRTIHAYLNALHATAGKDGQPLLDGATLGSCLGCLKDFTDHLTALERIRDTPIPAILNIHLQLLLFFYIAAVPLQLVKSMGLFVIPATSIAAIVFYGVDRAAEELSDPFGEEPNDLPLGKFCSDIHREYLELAGHGSVVGSAGNSFQPGNVSASEKKHM